MSKPRLVSTGFVCLAISLIFAGQTRAQNIVSGPNVNMVSGTTWPDGDPFLQRQNEPSIAVSTRNPLHVVAASNDYRTVDLPGLPDGLPTADSWIGVFTSLDGGGSWTSTLQPGYPQDLSVAGQASPAYGLQAAADPVMRAGTHGMFYLSTIVFDRGLTPQSKLVVSRYVDLNNDPAHPIQYIDTVEVVSFSFPSNVFIDKPWLAVDVPGSGASTTTFYVDQAGNPASPVSQPVECGNLYLSWAEIESLGDTVVESRIMSSTSTDCGDTWSSPIVISDPGTINQGAVVAVSPNPGNVYVAWRQLIGLGVTGACGRGSGYWKHHSDEWPLESLTLGGVTYSKPDALASLSSKHKGGDTTYAVFRQLLPAKLNHLLFDPEVSALIARADQWLMDHPLGSNPRKAAKSEGSDIATELKYYNMGTQGPTVCGIAPSGASDDAIMVTASTNGGGSFDSPSVVRSLQPWEPFDQGTTEWSFRTVAYPTMTVDAAGRIYIAWSERGEALPTADPDPVEGDGRIMVGTSLYPFSSSPWVDVNPIDRPAIPGHQIQPTISYINDHLFLVYNDFRQDYSGVFDRFVMDLLTVAQPYRHTVDIRAAVAYPGVNPTFSDYTLLPPEPTAQASRYLFMPTIQGGVLVFEQLDFNPPNLPMFKAGTVPFHGDYIDIAGAPPFVPDGSGGWMYNSSSAVEPIVHAVWTDNRDVIGPLDGDWTSFVPVGGGGTSIFDGTTTVPPCVGGTDDADRTGMRNQNIYTSRLTTGLYVAVPGNSRPLSTSFQRGFVVFVQNGTDVAKYFSLEILNQPAGGSASFDQFSVAPVTYDEIDLLAYSSASRTVFATSTNPSASIEVQVREIDPGTGLPVPGGLEQLVQINPDPSNPQPSDPLLLTGEVYNPAVLNPAVYNPAVYNPAVLNPAVFNPAVFNPAVFNQSIFNDAVLNYSVDNPAVFNPAVLNPAVYNPAVFNPAVFNQAVLAMSLMNPAVYNPAVLNPAVFNPAVLNPAVFNPAVFNPAVLNPAVLNPAVFNPAVFNPAVLNPAVMNPAVLNPAVYNTTFADGSATDFNLVAFNGGNATSAYSLNLSLLNQVPGFHYQLMVNRIYFTPVANDCVLTEAAQQELLVNDLDPDLTADLLDPDSDATFYLNPNDYAVVTLRITPDPDAPVPGDPSNFDLDDISAAVVAQAVNTDDVANGETQPSSDSWQAPNLPPLVITTVSLADATENVAYTATLTAAGGTGPLDWSLAPGSGPLPMGLTLSAAGVISGTPTVDGIFNITVRTTDYSQIDEQLLSLTVDPAGGVFFVIQPASTTAGQPISLFSVEVRDATNSPLPGITVDLAIGNYGCPTASLAPPAPASVTNALGVASFIGVSIDRGGFSYTLEATATPDGFTPVTAESDPFNLVGFCETGSMATPRVGHTETTLSDGRVLLVGGYSAPATPTATAEIYDPVSGVMSGVPGGMTGERSDHTATLLTDGRVLVAGGVASGVPLATAEIYDPGANSFTATGSMAQLRFGHTATRLASGNVLIVGGNAFPLTSELYNPAAGTFGPAAGTASMRSDHTATLLPSGQVLITGGNGGGYIAQNTVELYDPVGDAFSTPAGSNMSAARMQHTATLLSDGRVLVIGGAPDTTNPVHTSAEVFDPASNSFTATGSLGTPRARHDAVLLTNDAVLVVGGSSDISDATNAVASVEIYEPLAGTFTPTHSLDAPQFFSTSTLLPDATVLVAGGYNAPINVVLASADVYIPPGLEAPPTFELLWGGGGTTEGRFGFAWGLAVDSVGDVYVVEASGQRIQKFDNDGNFISTWGWGVDTGAATYEICTSGCQGGIAGTGAGQLNSSRGIAVDAAGQVYVAGEQNHRILKFTSSGTFVEAWGWGVATGSSAFEKCTATCQAGTPGPGDRQFTYPHAVAVSPVDSSVFVVDSVSNRIQKLSSSGDYLGMYGWGINGINLSNPIGAAVDSGGNLYVVDMGQSRIVKIGPAGTLLLTWGTFGSGAGQFDQPHGIAVDGADRIYVAERFNHRVQKFDSNGRLLTTWGNQGWSPGEFNICTEIAVDSTRGIFVNDHTERVQRFRGGG